MALAYFEKRRLPQLSIDKLLELMVKSLVQSQDAYHYRANVAVYDSGSKMLRIKHSHNMLGAVDRYLEMSPDQGCAGHAFSMQKPYWVDLTKVQHEEHSVCAHIA